MKKLFFILCLMFGLQAVASTSRPLAYVVELNEEVDNKMWHNTRRACDEAIAMKADIVVFHINTYGGEVAAADSIRTAIMRLPMTTVAYVDPNAASAGSLITLACDSVYMAPGASYGASSVVNQSGEIMPDKYQSYMKSIMRATAESHGLIQDTDSTWHWRRDPLVAESFVTVDSVRTLTPEEAVKIGYAEGIATSLDDVIKRNMPPEYEVKQFEPTATDHILGFLANAAVRAVLIMLIVGGIYMEMHSPGLGVAGGIAFVAAVLYFLPIAVSGTMASWVVVVFIIGLILLALEIFVIPGFGICGVAGIIAILASIVGGMLNGQSIESAYAVDIVNAVVITASGLVLATGLVWFLTSRYGPKCVRRISELQTELRESDGYVGVDMAPKDFVGKEGFAVTDMHPSGKIRIGNDDFDAVSLSGYIDRHRNVRVVKFENAQLYVRSI